ncbi:MAG: hypothetical protein FWD82_00415 [Defluviitaleaceae bacterium]|nr:hypothetical protein [Defluviitaleaceae bacterium]
MKKRIISFAIVFLMAFTVVSFLACDVERLDCSPPSSSICSYELADILARIKELEAENARILAELARIEALEKRIEALEAQNNELLQVIYDLTNALADSEGDVEILQEQLDALQKLVDGLLEQINDLEYELEYANEANKGLLGLLNALQKQVEGLQEMIERLEREVNGYWIYDITAEDFSLTITPTREFFYQGEDIFIYATFKNLSGRTLYIWHGFSLFSNTFIQIGTYRCERLTSSVLRYTVLAPNETVNSKVLFYNSRLLRGEHKVTADLPFRITRDDRRFSLTQIWQDIRVVANPITINIVMSPEVDKVYTRLLASLDVLEPQVRELRSIIDNLLYKYVCEMYFDLLLRISNIEGHISSIRLTLEILTILTDAELFGIIYNLQYYHIPIIHYEIEQLKQLLL